MGLFNILVDIAANTAQFETGIKRVEDQLSSFAETAQKAFEFAGISVGLHEIVSEFDEFIDKAAELTQTSQKIGIAVEDLSRLQFAATSVGVASESLTTGIERFAKTAEEAAAGSQKQAEAFAAIGVSVLAANGQIKPLNDLLNEVATKFASYKDSAEKTALAQILFSKSGADLIPVLNQGASGLATLEQRSDELGNTISTSTAKAADEFNVKLGELHGLSQSLWQTLAQQLLPSLTSITTGFTQSAAGADRLNTLASELATGFKLIATGAQTLEGVLEVVAKYYATILAAENAVFHGNFSQGLEILKIGFSDIGKSVSTTTSSIAGMWSDNEASSAAWSGALVADWNSVSNAAKTNAPIIGGSLTNLSAEMDAAYRKLEVTIGTKASDDAERLGNQGANAAKTLAEKIPAYGKTAWDQMDEISQTGAKQVQSAFSDFLFDPASKGLSGLATDFANALKRMLADALATDLFDALFGKDKEGNSGLGGILGGWLNGLGGGGGGFTLDSSIYGQTGDAVQSLFGGQLASGGPVESGKWYIAGEHGPEPIWGGGAGAFATGYGSSAPSVNVTNHNDFSGADAAAIPAIMTAIAKSAAQTKKDILTAWDRSGLRRPASA